MTTLEQFFTHKDGNHKHDHKACGAIIVRQHLDNIWNAAIVIADNEAIVGIGTTLLHAIADLDAEMDDV